MEELTLYAPLKNELVTHDGVVYFPKELDQQADNQEEQCLSARLSL